MKHLIAIKQILVNENKSPAEKFELVWQYKKEVLRPELGREIDEGTGKRVTQKECHLCWIIGDMLGLFRENSIPLSEWEDLCPLYLEGLQEFIDSECITTGDATVHTLPKTHRAMRAMADRRDQLVVRGFFPNLRSPHGTS